MIIPAHYMPPAKMKRIIMHWTAGRMSQIHVDKMHYHGVVGRDLQFYPGADIRYNAKPLDRSKPYAAHTLNYNEESIGLSMAGMALAQETPTGCMPGPEPITEAQYEVFIQVVNQYALRYAIPVTRETVFSHAEAPFNGVPQNGKWDFTRLPWCAGLIGARVVGDKIRRDILALRSEKKPLTETVTEQSVNVAKNPITQTAGSPLGGAAGYMADSEGQTAIQKMTPAADWYGEATNVLTTAYGYGLQAAGKLLMLAAVAYLGFVVYKHGSYAWRKWRASKQKPNEIEEARGVE